MAIRISELVADHRLSHEQFNIEAVDIGDRPTRDGENPQPLGDLIEGDDAVGQTGGIR